MSRGITVVILSSFMLMGIISCLYAASPAVERSTRIEVSDIDLVYCIVKEDKSKGIISFVLADDTITSIQRKVWQSDDGAVHIDLYKQGLESEQICKEKISGLTHVIRKGDDETSSHVDGFSFTFALDSSTPCKELYIGGVKMLSVNLLWNSPRLKGDFIMYDIEGVDY